MNTNGSFHSNHGMDNQNNLPLDTNFLSISSVKDGKDRDRESSISTLASSSSISIPNSGSSTIYSLQSDDILDLYEARITYLPSSLIKDPSSMCNDIPIQSSNSNNTLISPSSPSSISLPFFDSSLDLSNYRCQNTNNRNISKNQSFIRVQDTEENHSFHSTIIRDQRKCFEEKWNYSPSNMDKVNNFRPILNTNNENRNFIPSRNNQKYDNNINYNNDYNDNYNKNRTKEFNNKYNDYNNNCNNGYGYNNGYNGYNNGYNNNNYNSNNYNSNSYNNNNNNYNINNYNSNSYNSNNNYNPNTDNNYNKYDNNCNPNTDNNYNKYNDNCNNFDDININKKGCNIDYKHLGTSTNISLKKNMNVYNTINLNNTIKEDRTFIPLEEELMKFYLKIKELDSKAMLNCLEDRSKKEVDRILNYDPYLLERLRDQFISSGFKTKKKTVGYNDIPRPLNAFMIYRRHMTEQLNPNHLKVKYNCMNTEIAKYWHKEPQEVKNQYKSKSEIHCLIHSR
eukprot:jgi/Orpsp1_1/1190253/evm.model.d7180000077734.1